jgi:hypothetical protein
MLKNRGEQYPKGLKIARNPSKTAICLGRRRTQAEAGGLYWRRSDSFGQLSDAVGRGQTGVSVFELNSRKLQAIFKKNQTLRKKRSIFYKLFQKRY